MSAPWSVFAVLLLLAIVVALWWLLTRGDEYANCPRCDLDALDRHHGGATLNGAEQ